MTPTRLKRLSLLEQVDLLDGERIAELLLAPGSGAENPGLLALSRELLRRQRSEGAERSKSGFDRCQWIARSPSEHDDCKCHRPTTGGSPWCNGHAPLVWAARQEPDPGLFTPEELDWRAAWPSAEEGL